VGFDDLELCGFTNPALTTVAQPIYEMGAKAADLLFHRLRGEKVQSQDMILKTSLKKRDGGATRRRSLSGALLAQIGLVWRISAAEDGQRANAPASRGEDRVA
jgi:hypothetical protein